MMSPILKGTRSRNLFHCCLPLSLFFHFLKTYMNAGGPKIKTYQNFLIASDAATVALVIGGNSPPRSAKIPEKTGTRNVSSAISTTKAKNVMKAGYIIADLTWRR